MVKVPDSSTYRLTINMMRKSPAAIISPNLTASILDAAFELEPKIELELTAGLLLAV